MLGERNHYLLREKKEPQKETGQKNSCHLIFKAQSVMFVKKWFWRCDSRKPRRPRWRLNMSVSLFLSCYKLDRKIMYWSVPIFYKTCWRL